MTEAESAIRTMFQTYLDGYNELNAKKLARLHATPTIMVHRGEVFTLTDKNNVRYHESILAENAAEEHVWEMADIKIDQVAPTERQRSCTGSRDGPMDRSCGTTDPPT